MDKVRLDNFTLWAKAMPIKQARLHFAPTHLKDELASVPAISFSDAILTLDKTGMKDSEVMPKLLEAHKNIMTQNKRRSEILDQIDRHFGSMVVSGELRCFAFEFPRTFATEPVEILSDHWTARPDWNKGEFRANGLHLIELRVLAANAISTYMVSSPVAVQGRPPFRKDILEAHAALQVSGRFITKPKTHGYEQIRAWIRANRPNTRAASSKLDDDTISKALISLEKVETPK